MGRLSKAYRALTAPKDSKKGFSVKSGAIIDPGAANLKKFLAVENVLGGQLLTVIPPHNPYELISYNNGYHDMCIAIKVAAVVGQGYTCDPELEAHIKFPNSEYSFNELLYRTATDYYRHGYMFITSVRGAHTAAIYHAPALKTRLKYNRSTGAITYVRFHYEPGTGFLKFVEVPARADSDYEGISQLNNVSRQANEFYGEPDYIGVKPLLKMNWSIVYAANRFFEHGLMSDLAIIEQGNARDDDEIDDLKDYLTDHTKGVENAHKIIYLQVAPGESITFEKLQSDFPGQESTALRGANRDEIIAGHTMFPRLVGIVTAGAMGGGGEIDGQSMAFQELVANPGQRRLEEWFQARFSELGFPAAESFKLNKMNISTHDPSAQNAPGLIKSLQELRKQISYAD